MDDCLSYEEAEEGYEEAVRRLIETFRQSEGRDCPNSIAWLDRAVFYAVRMNEVCGGPIGSEFERNLRREILFECVSASGNVAERRDNP